VEYFSEWFLHHRTREELLALAAAIAPRGASVAVGAEPSGINLFLLLHR
jgi:hypothetical protein